MPETLSTERMNENTTDRQRKAHRKVKTGCKACKIRRQKCSEQRPRCAGCVRHSTECLYIPSGKITRRKPRETVPDQTMVSVDKAIQVAAAPKANPPASPSQDLNLEDLELLHQYITITCVATSQLPERTSHIQTTIPILAQTHLFLMRGILANAAVNLSWLRPSRKAHYILLAAKHHNAALPEFRSTMQNINEDNHAALIMYSKGLVWCSFAGFDAVSGHSAASLGMNTHWLPNWFYLLRGSCLIVESSAPWIKNGMHALPSLDDTTDFSNGVDNRRISALISQLLPLTGSLAARPVLLALKEAFARASMRHHNTPLRNAINYWVGCLPNEYIDALHKSEPWALVIIAHFGILVSRSETRWFMKGQAARLLGLTAERLASAWKQYIEWPCEEVGF